MAKKSPAPSRLGAFFRYLAERFSGIDEQRKRVWLKTGIKAAACALLAVLAYRGFEQLQHRVYALDKYQRPVFLEWEYLPDWLQLADNRHILDDLATRVDLGPNDRQLDGDLAARIGAALSAPDLGWIQTVERVKVRPDGIVSVHCTFRRPAAWICTNKFCYLIDQQGIRLPGRYEPSDCKDSALMTISGVQTAAPPIGQIWTGADLGAGVKLVSMLQDRPFRDQIENIDVDNFNGRKDPAKPFLRLVTDRPESTIWWGRPPGQEHGTEINAAQKITLLEALYRQWGRIDMNRSHVDITTWPDRVAMPMTIQPPAQARLLRG